MGHRKDNLKATKDVSDSKQLCLRDARKEFGLLQTGRGVAGEMA